MGFLKSNFLSIKIYPIAFKIEKLCTNSIGSETIVYLNFIQIHLFKFRNS